MMICVAPMPWEVQAQMISMIPLLASRLSIEDQKDPQISSLLFEDNFGALTVTWNFKQPVLNEFLVKEPFPM